MAKKDIINGLKMEIGKLDKSIRQLDEDYKRDRQNMLEERTTYVRMVNFISGDPVAEVPINAFAEEGEKAVKPKYTYPIKVGAEPTPGSKKATILDALRNAGPMTPKELCVLLDYPSGPLTGQLSMLKAQKLVGRNTLDGKYFAVKAADIEAAIHENGNGNGHHEVEAEQMELAGAAV